MPGLLAASTGPCLCLSATSPGVSTSGRPPSATTSEAAGSPTPTSAIRRSTCGSAVSKRSSTRWAWSRACLVRGNAPAPPEPTVAPVTPHRGARARSATRTHVRGGPRMHWSSAVTTAPACPAAGQHAPADYGKACRKEQPGNKHQQIGGGHRLPPWPRNTGPHVSPSTACRSARQVKRLR
jgi:hypothetical protein